MSAMGITKGLQEQFVESGVVTWNFQCAVFNDPDNFALVGPGWVKGANEIFANLEKNIR